MYENEDIILGKLRTNREQLDNMASQIALILNGTYDTLLDLETAYPTGNSGVYLVRADNSQYSWSGTAWVIYIPTIDAGTF